jgi:N-methylhydantoinase A
MTPTPHDVVTPGSGRGARHGGERSASDEPHAARGGSEADDEPAIVVGIDVGGTFTDVFALDERSGRHHVAKVTSTRTAEAVGFLRGVRAAVAPLDPGRADDALARVVAIIHGTTVGTNALLERKGACTGIIATEGFADVLEMRRRDRPRTWGLWGEFRPVVSRQLRREVGERVLADGSVVEAVDVAEVVAEARKLLADGAVAIAVTFLHSYANDANEVAAAAAIRAMWPNEHVSISSEILPEIREFERTSTTALNAYLQPVVGDYLRQLEVGLAEAAFGGHFFVVQSNGGVMTVDAARRFPVRTALSGPAAGVIAAERIATAAGRVNVLTGDMGGTSFDVAVIADGRSVLAAQTTIDFGLVVRSPMIEITTIGAGGGSIAWVDRAGLLQIGPESAGGVPGPVCYGQGNTRPTVTDANVVLGRINADRPIGERPRLDVEAARAAIDEHVGKPLGLGVDEAAEAILRVAESRMSGALRLVSIERGHDPTQFWMMPFGGAGALHCCAFVNDVELAGALVPRHPGVISALGCVIADMRRDYVRTVQQPLASLDGGRLSTVLAEAIADGRAALADAGIDFDRTEVRIEVDMSYVGQTHTVPCPLDAAVVDAIHSDSASGSGSDSASDKRDTDKRDTDKRDTDTDLGAALQTAFETTYIATYGRLLDGIAVRVLTVRVAVVGVRPRFDLATLVTPATPGPNVDAAPTAVASGVRSVYFDGRWLDTQVWDRLSLPVGSQISGPAICEQPDATTVIAPGFVANVDGWGNLEIVRANGPGAVGSR